jgi:hypothetical protein
MKRYLMPITFLLSLAFSGFSFGKESWEFRPGIESSLEARVGERPSLADAETLNELLGGPDEGNILEKLRGLFFRNEGDIYLRITRDALKEYFREATSGDAINTSNQILENFLYMDIHSGENGGLFVAMEDTTRFSVEHGLLDLDCEISPIYYSKTIGRFAVASGDSFITNYSSRIESGYAEMDICGWLSGPLDFFRVDRMKEPKFRMANYILTLNGEYYAVFGVERGEFGRLGEIFDNRNNKYERKRLGEEYKEFYDECEEKIEEDFRKF